MIHPPIRTTLIPERRPSLTCGANMLYRKGPCTTILERYLAVANADTMRPDCQYRHLQGCSVESAEEQGGW